MIAPFSVFQDKITTDMNSDDRQSARTGRRKAFTEESFLGDMGVENKENHTMNMMKGNNVADDEKSQKRKNAQQKMKNIVLSSPKKSRDQPTNKQLTQEDLIPTSHQSQQHPSSQRAKMPNQLKNESPNQFDLLDVKTPKKSSMPLIYGSHVTMDSPDPLSAHHKGTGPQSLSPFERSGKSTVTTEQFTRPPISPWSNKAYNTPQKDINDHNFDRSPTTSNARSFRGSNNSKSSLFAPLSPATLSTSSPSHVSMPLIYGSNVVVPSPDPLSRHHEEKTGDTGDVGVCNGKMMSPIPETCETIGGSPFGGIPSGRSGNQIVAAARRSTGIDLDSPDRLSKFNATNGDERKENSPITIEDHWERNSSHSPRVNAESNASPFSSHTPPPKQFDFYSKPIDVPDISSLSVSPDEKPRSSRFRRSTEYYTTPRVAAEPKTENAQHHFNYEDAKLQLDDSREKRLQTRGCSSPTYSDETKDINCKGAYDEEYERSNFIDIDSREEARQSKSRIRSLQSISKSRSSTDLVVDGDCKGVHLKPSPPSQPRPPSIPKNRSADINDSMGITTAPRRRWNVVLPGSKKTSPFQNGDKEDSSADIKSPIPPPIKTQPNKGEKCVIDASPNEGLRYSPDSVAANLSPVGFEPLQGDKLKSQVETHSSSSAKEMDPMELEDELLGESLLEQRRGEESKGQDEFFDCIDDDDDIDILSPYKEYDRNVINYSDYDGCVRLMRDQQISNHVITLNLPNKFGGEKFFRSGGRNYAFRAVLEPLPERQKTLPFCNIFPHWMIGKLNEIKTRMTADKRRKKSSVQTTDDSDNEAHPFNSEEYQTLSEDKKFEFEVKLQGEYVKRYIKRFTRDMNIMVRRDVEKENRRKRRSKANVQYDTNVTDLSEHDRKTNHKKENVQKDQIDLKTHPFLENPPESVFEKITGIVQRCTSELHHTGIL